MGRKPVADLVPGDEFTHTFYGDCRFIRWQAYGQMSGHAVVFAFGMERNIPLNPAGSVKVI